ncbi:DUF2256 domain-containing protein [Saprospira grandis]|uniref:DUF2256 domain-containing protein n=1 Tax=Saprospira grandis (strain Lewin) TaxID=984262 RepID=H6L3Z0_SAPGL|nr:DUF2256 domain-containing protein [Saprospira grandis]AFC23872.1 hypothetical protein SGRA_1137 [Saprospira grandis str. Lewin]
MKKASRKKPWKKEQLPSKICIHCGRPFNWRKKWAKNWDAVKYCSKACRNGKTPTTSR